MARLSSLRGVVVTVVAMSLALFAGTAAGQSPGTVGDAPPERIVLEPLLVALVGTEAVYYIEHVYAQTIVDVAGFFILIDVGAMEQQVEAAAIVHYTMLEPNQAGQPRVLVHAVAYDPYEERVVDELRWIATYALSEDGAVHVDGDVIPDSYEDVVKPDWLVDWSFVAPEDRPAGPVNVGDEWRGAANMDWSMAADIFEQVDMSATGIFVGWTDEDGRRAPAAFVSEYTEGSGTGLFELGEGLHAQAELYTEAGQHYELAPGTFPYGMSGLLNAHMSFRIGPESGATFGIEGFLDTGWYAEQHVEQLSGDAFPWWVFRKSYGSADDAAGREVAEAETLFVQLLHLIHLQH